MTRHLLITRRRIPLDRFEAYRALWSVVRSAADAAGARAWVFEAERGGDYFTEFVEWQGPEGTSILEHVDFAIALDDLTTSFPSEDSDTWLEAKI